MNLTARIISVYAADISGVCSALYEYGGMTVIHDASGCNSTYTTHDEPRWYDTDSMVYISALTENDAVMGNDEKFISDLCDAAGKLRPAFIAVCGSPMPAMTGVDLEAIAFDTGNRTGIPSFAVKTNGMHSYISGAGRAFESIAVMFSEPAKKSDSFSVNILGATPLDLSLNGTLGSIKELLRANGIEVNACLGMGSSLDEVKRLSAAHADLVISSAGKLTAEYLLKEYGIPYVIGIPFGGKLSDRLTEALRGSAVSGKCTDIFKECRKTGYDLAIVGESILSSSLAAALSLEKDISARVVESVGDSDKSVLLDTDISAEDEDIIEKELERSHTVIADPLFEPICRKPHFVRLPHEAFSGRCFSKEIPNLIGTELDKFIEKVKV